MKYMLDTNICIYVIKHKPDTVIRRFLCHNPDEMCISAITYAEMMHGAPDTGETTSKTPFLKSIFENLIGEKNE